MMPSPLLRLVEGAIARPKLTITALLGLVLVLAPGLARLELRTDGHALIPPRDPAILFDAEVRQHFGLRDPLAVHIETEHPEGIYNVGTLRRVQALTDALTALPGVGDEHVASLATERRDKVYPGTLRFRPFLDPFPDTPELLAEMRQDVDATTILHGTLVALDGRSTVILVGVPNLPPEAAPHAAERIDLYRRILAAVAPFDDGEDRIAVVGAPVAEFLLGVHILQDLRLLVPLSLLVIAAVLFVGCRRPWGVLLGLGEVGACLLAVFGLMGWLGIPVYLPTAVLPVILTTLGLADEIHIFWHYQHLLARRRDGQGQLDVVRRTFADMVPPVALTSFTTALGFLSFLASPIEPVRRLGVFAAVGILFCLLWSLTVIPASLTLLPADRMARPGARGDRPGPAWTGGLAVFLNRRRGAVLAALALATVGLGVGAGRLFVQDSWLDGFGPESAFRQATERVDASFFGTHLLLVHLDLGNAPADDGEAPMFGRQGPLLSPHRLRALDDFERAVADLPEVGGVLGPGSHLRTVRYLWLARRDGVRELPDTARQIQTVVERFDMARGEHLRRRVIDDDLRRVVLTLFLRDANYLETASLIAAVNRLHAEHLEPLGMQLGLAGDVAVSQAMIPAIVDTQVTSLLLALASALLAVCLLRRSVKQGLLAVLPALLAVLWAFGAMGWSGVPLGVATSMFCAITLGIGIDFGIHFTARFEAARGRRDASPLATALGESAPAIVADAVAVALGFGLLAVSQVPANARLGLLVAFALSVSCLLTLAGVGALLARRQGDVAGI